MDSTAAPTHVPPLGIQVCEEVGNELQPTLLELIDLSVVGKQLRCSVVGRSFRSLHLQLDKLIKSWRDLADTAAERAMTIGFWPDGQAIAVAAVAEHIDAGAVGDQHVVREVTHRVANSIPERKADLRQGPPPGLQVVVDDVEAAQAQLRDAGVDVGDVQHAPTGRFVFFSDPDGHDWAVQQFRTRG
jgi:starvation-inducible DNA-binding protein